jgi:hypothetical protein
MNKLKKQRINKRPYKGNRSRRRKRVPGWSACDRMYQRIKAKLAADEQIEDWFEGLIDE